MNIKTNSKLSKGGESLKRISVFLFFALIGIVGMAFSTPAFNTVMSSVGDVTVDSQYTGSWQNVGNLIVATTDSARVLLTITGTAALDPGDLLYIGLGNDSANVVSGADATLNNNLDSLYFKYPKLGGSGKIYLPFVGQVVWTSLDGSTTDTIFFNAASGGNSVSEQVELYDVVVSAAIGDL